MRKIFAIVIAAAMLAALGAPSLAATAGVINAGNLIEFPNDWWSNSSNNADRIVITFEATAAIKSVTVSGTLSAEGAEAGGAITLQNPDAGWAATEWGNEGAGKPITFDANGTKFSFKADVTGDAPAGPILLVIEPYWSNDGAKLTVDTIKFSDGTTFKVSSAGKITRAAASSGGGASNPKTGDNSFALFALIALAVSTAGVAVVKKVRA